MQRGTWGGRVPCRGRNNFPSTRFGWGAARHPLCLIPPPSLSYSRPYARNKNWKKWKNEKNEKVNFFSHFKIPKIQLVSCVKEFNFHTYIHIYNIKKSTVKPPLHQVHMILYLVQCQLQVVDKSVSSSWQDKKKSGLIVSSVEEWKINWKPVAFAKWCILLFIWIKSCEQNLFKRSLNE